MSDAILTLQLERIDDLRQLLRECRMCLARFRGSHNAISAALHDKLCGCNNCMEFIRIETLLMNRGITNAAEVLARSRR
jgi:hypothetical protein